MTTHNLIRPFLTRLMQISASGSVVEFVAVSLRRGPPCSRTHAGRTPVVENTYSSAKPKAPGSEAAPRAPTRIRTDRMPRRESNHSHVAGAASGNGRCQASRRRYGCLPEIHPADGRRGCRIKRRNPLWWARCNGKDTFKGCGLGLVGIIREA
jgi:hypothetical protein